MNWPSLRGRYSPNRYNREVLAPIMDMCYAMAANLTMEQATERFEAQRVPFAMILSPEEITRDPHALAIGLFEEAHHHIVGRTRMPRHPAQFNGTPAKLGVDSPGLGEHTNEVLTELGRGDEIERLRADNVVA